MQQCGNLGRASSRQGEVRREMCGCDEDQAGQDPCAAPAPDGCHVSPSGKRANWACRRHLVELLVEQRGRCGICLEPMRADEIETWAVSRIRPEWAGGRREKENCQVVHPACASAKGAKWEEAMEAQVWKWARWKLGE